ncbi:MAG: hypothetical protein LW875_12445 [Proteobacteria bacterium]|nr:hypothetical protein [Pseudomonadota bacterium]
MLGAWLTKNKVSSKLGNRVPRVFPLSQSLGERALNGLQLIWPDRSVSSVKALSLSGLVVSSAQKISVVKPLMEISLKLRIEIAKQDFFLDLIVERVNADSLAFSFQKTAAGRLALEQVVKDRIVSQNLVSSAVRFLPESFRADYWLQGPFDTNFLIWRTGQFLIEYDGLVLDGRSGDLKVWRSSGMVDAVGDYAEPWKTSSPLTVSLGASYLDRVLRFLDEMKVHHPELHSVYRGLVQFRVL